MASGAWACLAVDGVWAGVAGVEVAGPEAVGVASVVLEAVEGDSAAVVLAGLGRLLG